MRLLTKPHALSVLRNGPAAVVTVASGTAFSVPPAHLRPQPGSSPIQRTLLPPLLRMEQPRLKEVTDFGTKA